MPINEEQAAWLSDRLGVAARSGGSVPLVGIVAYRKALLGFETARKIVAGQIAALEKAIPETLPDEAELARSVAARLAEFTDEIGDAIDAAINAAKSEREPYNDTTRQMIASYLQELEADPLVQHVDTNPFHPVDMRDTLGAALGAIATHMV